MEADDQIRQRVWMVHDCEFSHFIFACMADLHVRLCMAKKIGNCLLVNDSHICVLCEYICAFNVKSMSMCV